MYSAMDFGSRAFSLSAPFAVWLALLFSSLLFSDSMHVEATDLGYWLKAGDLGG